MVKSNPRAGKGVKMSENMMTPSTPNDRQGCKDNSMAMSGVSERCRKGYFSEYLRKSAMYRPAWRINLGLVSDGVWWDWGGWGGGGEGYVPYRSSFYFFTTISTNQNVCIFWYCWRCFDICICLRFYHHMHEITTATTLYCPPWTWRLMLKLPCIHCCIRSHHEHPAKCGQHEMKHGGHSPLQ